MAKRTIDNVKLGIFVLSGLIMLVFALYMIGKDTNLFSKNYTLKAHFNNIGGLLVGNNVRYSGIQVGTVKAINLLNDTTIEVTMIIDEKMKNFIHKNDKVAIGTDGLVGNKLLNVTPSTKNRTVLAQEGDVLEAKEGINTDEMLETLGKTNKNIADISEDLKSTVHRLNNSTTLWKILNEETLPNNLKTTFINIRNASAKANNMIAKTDAMAAELQAVVHDIQLGKGSLGGILKDTTVLVQLNQAVDKIKMVGDNANHLAIELNDLTQDIKQDVSSGKGIVTTALKDTALVQKINATLSHVESGTANFNQNMEALKHNFFFKGYFKKLEKQKKKEEKLKKKNTAKFTTLIDNK